jgi:hypothetical protein
MRCFYHQEKEAIGTCKSCGKGLCPDCAVDLGKGLACRGHCEEDAKAVIQLIDRNIKLTARTENILQTGSRVRSSAAIFNFVIGIVFTAWGIIDFDRSKFLLVLGVCFLAYGLFGLAKWRDRKQ